MTPIATQTAFDILKQLYGAGSRFIGLAPGSRSTPLVNAVSMIWPRSAVTVHFDERGLGFWGVGIGKSTGQPAIIIVTSGTAVANLLPSAIEADYSNTPIIYLTADRPSDLIDVGANQAIRQANLLAPYCRYSTDLHPPDSERDAKYWHHRINTGLAILTSGQPGPIHFNVRFREPLWQSHDAISDDRPLPVVQVGNPTSPSIDPISTGSIVIGEGASMKDLPQSIRDSTVPIWVDALSKTVPGQDRFYVDSSWRGLAISAPDPLVWLGGKLISKSLNAMISTHPGTVIQLAPFPINQDPELRVDRRIVGHIPALCKALTPRDGGLNYRPITPNYFEQWSELSACAVVVRELTASWSVVVGNSMPIRCLDLVRSAANSSFDVVTNRGASGIDGLIATAHGVSTGTQRRTLIIVGDLSALHDLNSFAMSTESPFFVVIFNNDGGGIFSHLPIADHPQFDAYFRTPHGYRFEDVAKQFNWRYHRLDTLESATESIPTIMAQDGRHVIEFVVNYSACYAHINAIKSQLHLTI